MENTMEHSEYYKTQKAALIRVSMEDLAALQRRSPVQKFKDSLKKLAGKDVRDRDELFWPLGMLLLGLLEAGELAPVTSFFDQWICRGCRVLYPDDALAAYVLVRLYEQTGEKRYLDGADAASAYLRTAERDAEGAIVYQPGKRARNILADGVGMTALFLHRYGICRSDENAVRNALFQLDCFMKHAVDEETGLPYHGYDLENAEKKGLIGWGRAAGWLMMGMAECGTVSRFAGAILKYQRPDGLFPWHLPAEDPSDTSATGMIAWSLLGFPDEEYRTSVRRMLEGLAGQIQDGRVEGSLAECVDFGVHPQKYGHYPWGQGAVLAALAGAYRNR